MERCFSVDTNCQEWNKRIDLPRKILMNYWLMYSNTITAAIVISVQLIANMRKKKERESYKKKQTLTYNFVYIVIIVKHENFFRKRKKKLEVLSMLCNIKSLTSRCLIGYRDRWISVSQKSRGKSIISLRFFYLAR